MNRLNTIAEYIVEGYTRDEVARKLDISVETLRKYLYKHGWTWIKLFSYVRDVRSYNIPSPAPDEQGVVYPKSLSIFDYVGGISFIEDCHERGLTKHETCLQVYEWLPKDSKFHFEELISESALNSYLFKHNYIWSNRNDNGVVNIYGGLDYLRSLKKQYGTLKEASRSSGLPISTISMYCTRNGTKWSEL